MEGTIGVSSTNHVLNLYNSTSSIDTACTACTRKLSHRTTVGHRWGGGGFAIVCLHRSAATSWRPSRKALEYSSAVFYFVLLMLFFLIYIYYKRVTRMSSTRERLHIPGHRLVSWLQLLPVRSKSCFTTNALKKRRVLSLSRVSRRHSGHRREVEIHRPFQTKL